MPKVLHEAGGRPLVMYCVQLMKELGMMRSIVVLGHKHELVRAVLPDYIEVALQPEQLGTGHAVMCAAPLFSDFKGTLLLLYGDVPLLRTETLRKLMSAHAETGAAITVLTTLLDDPSGYGRIVRGTDGLVERIVEHKDATEDERAIKEINSGIYCFRTPLLLDALKQLKNDNAQGEYYVTDTVGILRGMGYPIAAVIAEDSDEVLGVNNLDELAYVDRVIRSRGQDAGTF
jgi:bifunctional UDP-N-acetylglucosamine pyrophosphorylase/glucosamine-1-phosphate N-acetyltransferase